MKRHFCFQLLCRTVLQIIDILRHERLSGRILLYVKIKNTFSLVFFDFLKNLHTVFRSDRRIQAILVVILAVRFFHRKRQQIATGNGIPLSFFIRICIQNIFDLFIYARLLCVLPEHITVSAIVIMPRLIRHDIMQNIGFLDRKADVSENFSIPALIQPIYAVFADQIQIVLVLCHNKIILIQIINETIQHAALSELSAIDHDHARVKEIVSGNPDNLLRICTEFIHLHHCLLVASSDIGITDINTVQLTDISLHNSVAVNINRLLVLRKHFRNEKSVICSFGIIITDGKSVVNRCKLLCHVAKTDFKIFILQFKKLRLHSVGNKGVQNIDMISFGFRSVLNHGIQRNNGIFNEIIVTSIKNRYSVFVHFLNLPDVIRLLIYLTLYIWIIN